jgi:hypothetical protein
LAHFLDETLSTPFRLSALFKDADKERERQRGRERGEKQGPTHLQKELGGNCYCHWQSNIANVHVERRACFTSLVVEA